MIKSMNVFKLVVVLTKRIHTGTFMCQCTVNFIAINCDFNMTAFLEEVHLYKKNTPLLNTKGADIYFLTHFSETCMPSMCLQATHPLQVFIHILHASYYFFSSNAIFISSTTIITCTLEASFRLFSDSSYFLGLPLATVRTVFCVLLLIPGGYPNKNDNHQNRHY